jgi:hypothetical protein
MTSETKQARVLRHWNALTPEQRDYDRFVARRIPHGASKAPETEDGAKMRDAMYDRASGERGCSCHISPPCSWCTEEHLPDPEESLALAKGAP